MRSLYLAVALIFYTKSNVKHGGGGDDDDDDDYYYYQMIIIIIIIVVIKSTGPNDCQTNKHPTVAKSSNQGILIFKSGPQHATSLGFGIGVGFTLT